MLPWRIADYYWPWYWTDWHDFDSDEEREAESEIRLEQRRRDFPISRCKPLAPFKASQKQLDWERDQAQKSNARRFAELKRGRD